MVRRRVKDRRTAAGVQSSRTGQESPEQRVLVDGTGAGGWASVSPPQGCTDSVQQPQDLGLRVVAGPSRDWGTSVPRGWQEQ